MTLTLGIDIGTSGVRTAVLEEDSLLSTTRADHVPQDPDRIDAAGWWTAVRSCLSAQMTALEAVGAARTDINGIAVDGTSGSMVITDAALQLVSPALMYNSQGFDAEAAQIAQWAQGPHITKGSNSALGRAMRLANKAPDKAAHLLHQADFIAAKLMGAGGQSDFNNCLKTGFDPETETWPDWIDEVFDRALLPEVHSPGAIMGEIAPEIAAEFGLSPGTLVHAGTTDSIAAFLAAAPLAPGVAVTSLGSTLAIKKLSFQRIDDPEIGLYSHRIGDHWLVGGASNTGGAVLKSFFSVEELATLSAQIDLSEPSGLDYYPLLRPGERFPVNDPNLQPRLTPRPASDAAFLHGMLEAMARIEAACYGEIEARGGGRPQVIYTAGGGAKNPVWTALRARALGITPTEAAHSEAAVGAARLAQT